MSGILSIKKEGYKTLYRVAKDVKEGESVTSTVLQMFDLMYKGRGIGLAANQVGLLKRIIVVDAGGFKQAFINPVITKGYGGKSSENEGCLSFPGKLAMRTRDRQIIVEGFTPDWKPIKRKLKGITARCVQHEIDHLNGITIVDEGENKE